MWCERWLGAQPRPRGSAHDAANGRQVPHRRIRSPTALRQGVRVGAVAGVIGRRACPRARGRQIRGGQGKGCATGLTADHPRTRGAGAAVGAEFSAQPRRRTVRHVLLTPVDGPTAAPAPTPGRLPSLPLPLPWPENRATSARTTPTSATAPRTRNPYSATTRSRSMTRTSRPSRPRARSRSSRPTEPIQRTRWTEPNPPSRSTTRNPATTRRALNPRRNDEPTTPAASA